MNYVDPSRPGGTQERKQALIRALRGSRGSGMGGAARLNASTPFGAIPRLGFRPDARSVFNRNENFNFGGAAGGQQEFLSNVSAPNMQQPQLADTGGVGPAAGAGVGGGLPQNSPSTGGFSGGGAEGSTQHLLEQARYGAPSGGVPQRILDASNGGASSGGVAEWLAANPWYLEQILGGGGGAQSGGGTVL